MLVPRRHLEAMKPMTVTSRKRAISTASATPLTPLEFPAVARAFIDLPAHQG